MSTEGSCEVVEVEPGRFQARLPPTRRRRRHATNMLVPQRKAWLSAWAFLLLFGWAINTVSCATLPQVVFSCGGEEHQVGAACTLEQAGLVCDALTSERLSGRGAGCRVELNTCMYSAWVLCGASYMTFELHPLACWSSCRAVCSQSGAGLRAGPGHPAAAQPAAGERPDTKVGMRVGANMETNPEENWQHN